jgi:hypothetical protein
MEELPAYVLRSPLPVVAFIGMVFLMVAVVYSADGSSELGPEASGRSFAPFLKSLIPQVHDRSARERGSPSERKGPQTLLRRVRTHSVPSEMVRYVAGGILKSSWMPKHLDEIPAVMSTPFTPPPPLTSQGCVRHDRLGRRRAVAEQRSCHRKAN